MKIEAYMNTATKARIRARVFLFMVMGSTASIGRGASYSAPGADAIRQRPGLQ